MGLIYGYEAYAYELIKEINNDKINKIKDEFDINLISILKNQITDFLHENYNNINVVYKEKENINSNNSKEKNISKFI